MCNEPAFKMEGWTTLFECIIQAYFWRKMLTTEFMLLMIVKI